MLEVNCCFHECLVAFTNVLDQAHAFIEMLIKYLLGKMLTRARVDMLSCGILFLSCAQQNGVVAFKADECVSCMCSTVAVDEKLMRERTVEIMYAVLL